MSDSVKGAPKSDISSPTDGNAAENKVLGGIPAEKDVKAIAKENTPKRAPRSIRG